VFERPAWLETNYYEVLGVRANASSREVDAAFRRLAAQSGGGGGAVDGAVLEAYGVLGDAGKRVEYDKLIGDLAAGRQCAFDVSGSGSRYCRGSFASVATL
jgi:curved DNA-binding protein CbpA